MVLGTKLKIDIKASKVNTKKFLRKKLLKYSRKMADIRSLEHPTLKVPYELLNKKFRSAQKILDREISHVHAAVTQIEDYIKHCDGNVWAIPSLLETLSERLQSLSDKYE